MFCVQTRAGQHSWIPRREDYCEEDEHLFSFSSMDGGLRPLRAKLKDCGIIEETGDSNEAVFQETIVHGGGYGCDWLEFELGPDFLVCWLKGHDRGELVYATFL